jgi:GH25 family lysozyme M1 (1,4-beta-N-acetylmuramidase)
MSTGHRLLATTLIVAIATITPPTPASASPPPTRTAAAATTTIRGQDVSSWQGNINWPAQYRAGSRFAYVKATEGTYYRNPYFTQQYEGSYHAGLIHGAYHFATPDTTTGKTQADYFINHGGAWTKDGKTLPGMLDIEYNPYGPTCYHLTQQAMRTWIASFITEYHTRTTRWATIYTTTDWWTTCTGNYPAFWNNDPLSIAHYANNPGTLPAGTPFWSFWQYSHSGPFAGDSDQWNGTYTRLKILACNGPC